MREIKKLIVSDDKVIEVGSDHVGPVGKLSSKIAPYLNAVGATFVIVDVLDNGVGKQVVIENYNTASAIAAFSATKVSSVPVNDFTEPKRPPRLKVIGNPCPTFRALFPRMQGVSRNTVLFKAMGFGSLPVTLTDDLEYLERWLAKDVTEAAYMTIKRHVATLGYTLPPYSSDAVGLVAPYFTNYPVEYFTKVPTYEQLCFIRKLGLFDLAT